MKLEDQVVSLPLAKKLKELGVRQESYFLWYGGKVLRENQLTQELRRHEPPVAAFTVAELGEMLPDTVIPKTGQLYSGQYRHLNIDKSDNDCWFVAYLPQDYDSHDEAENQMLCAEERESDARAAMVIYLIENQLITV